MAMVLACLSFAGMIACVKQVSHEIPLFQVTFFRSMVSVLLIGGFCLRHGIQVRGEHRKLLFFRSLAGFVAMCLNFYSVAKIGLGDAALLNQCSPLFVLLISWIYLGEKFHFPLFGLTLISFIGMVLIFRPSGAVFNLAGAAGLLSAVFAASAFVAIRQLHETESSWVITFYFMATAAVFSLPPMLMTWKTPTGPQWFMLLLSGIFGTLGQLLMTYAYKHEKASWVSPFGYSTVLFSFALGMIFFGEMPDFYTLIGAFLLVASGIGLVTARSMASQPIPEPVE